MQCANFVGHDICGSHSSLPTACSEVEDIRVVRNVGKYSPSTSHAPEGVYFHFLSFIPYHNCNTFRAARRQSAVCE